MIKLVCIIQITSLHLNKFIFMKKIMMIILGYILYSIFNFFSSLFSFRFLSVFVIIRRMDALNFYNKHFKHFSTLLRKLSTRFEKH